MFFVVASTLIAIIIAVFIAILVKKSKNEFKKYDNIPGPEPTVFLGNVGLFFGCSTPLSKRLYTVYDSLHKKYCKEGFFLLFLGHRPILMVFKPSLVKRILTNKNFINKSSEYKAIKPWLGNGLLTSDGELWRCKRKLLSHTFNEKVLHQYLPAINDQIRIFVQILKANCSRDFIDIRPFVNNFVLDLVSVTTMGTSLNAQFNVNDEYQSCLRNVFNDLLDRVCNPLFWYDFVFYRLSRGKKFNETVETLHKFSTNVIQQRKKSPIKVVDIKKSRRLPILDLLLLQQKEDSTITDNDVREDVDTFMFGACETMFSCLTWTLFLLGCYPNVQEKIKEELKLIFGENKCDDMTSDDLKKMKYIEAVIYESLRLYPPAPIIGRVSEDDFNLDGHSFCKGFTLYLFLYKCHRDQKCFPNPDVFMPERLLGKNNGNVEGLFPFSLGARNCIGQQFAMISLKCTVAHIVQNVSLKSLNKEEDIELLLEGVLRPASEIRIKFIEDYPN